MRASNGVVLGRMVLLDIALGAILVALWYVVFARLNRRRAVRVLRWIDHAFAAHGQIAGVQWLAPSRFRVRMRLAEGVFRHPSMIVQLLPRETPFNWFMTHVRKQHETLTFEADLDCAPTFNLDVHNHRWCGRTARRVPKSTKNWDTEYAGPFVISTRNDWQREVTTMMNALVAARDCDCMNVKIKRTSPHFSATVPLAAISPGSEAHAELFDIFRELATGASASLS